MAWQRPGDKPLSELMMISLVAHIYASLGLKSLNEFNSTLHGFMIIHSFFEFPKYHLPGQTTFFFQNNQPYRKVLQN